MDIEELLNIMDGKIIKKGKKRVNHFCIDTRNLKKKDVYIALIGKTFDGHDYLKEAERIHASYAIVSKIPKELYKMGLIYVKDTEEALQKLAAYKRRMYQIPLIAVTGSVGKTTLKEMIACILESKYRVLKNEGNKNNHIGVPLTLLKLNSNYDVIVTELGMNHKKEISKLSKISKPTIGVISKIGTSHIGNLGSKKGIYKAKMEILDGMEKGFLVLNGKDKYLKKAHTKKAVTVIKVFKDKMMELCDLEVTEGSTNFSFRYQKKKYFVHFPYPGMHYPDLILLAISTSMLLGVSIEDAISSLNHFQIVGNRLKIESWKENVTLINDAYNASYESFLSVLKLLEERKEKKILIVGDMLELGKFSKKYHLKLIHKMNHIKKKEVWAVGEMFLKLRKKIKDGTVFTDNEALKEKILGYDFKDEVVLLKGAHAMHLEEMEKLMKEKKRA